MRFSMLAAICQVLECQPGDLLEHAPDPNDVRDTSENA
ncbi:helix-turn-helix domain-containing protein [Hymenobacter actinosclerus]|nr:helix-turn-helix domain-containing protein [Hymenobacter actinosclerus]